MYAINYVFTLPRFYWKSEVKLQCKYENTNGMETKNENNGEMETIINSTDEIDWGACKLVIKWKSYVYALFHSAHVIITYIINAYDVYEWRVLCASLCWFAASFPSLLPQQKFAPLSVQVF